MTTEQFNCCMFICISLLKKQLHVMGSILITELNVFSSQDSGWHAGLRERLLKKMIDVSKNHLYIVIHELFHCFLAEQLFSTNIKIRVHKWNNQLTLLDKANLVYNH